MKKIFTLVFISFLQTILAQNNTAPTGTSTEVGETAGELSVSLSGAATYNIPIQVPPGLNGVVPQLSLNYSSQSGNGIAGYGWNIGGLSAITRIPSTKFHDGTNDPVDFDALDRFALDGQRLIVKAGTTGVYGANNTVYEIENFSNLRITSFGVHPSGANYGPAWFKVEYPDGSVAEYGNSTDAVSLTTWAIKVWKNAQNVCLNYVYTIDGNTIYPKEINYGATVGNIQQNKIEFQFTNRERVEQYYIAGISVENKLILHKIKTFNQLEYVLNYSVTTLKYQKLISIQEINVNDGSPKILNPTVFEYGDVIDPGFYTANTNITIDKDINATTTEKTIIVDFTGDGNSDYIFIPKMPSSSTLPTTYSLFNGALSNNALVTTVVGGYKDIFPTTFLKGNSSTGFKLNPSEGWTVITDNIPSFGPDVPVTINFKTYAYDPATPTTVITEQSKQFIPPNQPCTVYKQPGVIGNRYIKYLNGDFNGDGFTDVVTILAGQAHDVCGIGINRKINELFFIDLKKDVSTNYSTSYGLLAIPNGDPFGGFSNNTYHLTERDDISIVDFNGDGQSDLMLVDRSDITIYTLDHSNKTLKLLTKFVKSGTFLYDPTFAMGWINLSACERFTGDFNGDGKTDLAFQSKFEGIDDWAFLISNGINFEYKRARVGLNYVRDNATLVAENTCPAPSICPIISKTYLIQKAIFTVKDFNNDGKSDIALQKQVVYYYTLNRNKIICPRMPSFPVPFECYYPDWQWGSEWIPDYSNSGRIQSTDTFLSSNIAGIASNISFAPKTITINNANTTYLNTIVASTNILNDNKFNLNNTLINGTAIKSFALARNFKNDMLLKKVTSGNGSTESIEYKPLKSEGITTADTPTAYNIFTPATNVENHPNFDLNNAQGLMVVSKLEKTSKNTNKKQLFAYSGAVSNAEGLGFLGFRSTMRTDWFDDEAKIFSNITHYDISRRSAPVTNYTVAGFVVPNLDYNPTEYVTKSISTYNTAADALQTNKVFKLKNTKTETWNKLDNTSSETTSVLDVYNNPTLTTSHFKNGTVIEKTTTNTIVYDNQPSATKFIIGRPTSKIVNVKIYPNQTDEDISISEELYTYTNHLLTKIQKRATNSGIQTTFLTEDNIFDVYGNITRKTITADGETPRVTNFEYSAIYGSRFLTKSIDVELLETAYTYDPTTGQVLTELMPSIADYPLLTTNSYDRWGKKIKVKNYLNKEVNYTYSRESEKTLITITSDDGSSTTELYDDLGRKLKTGSKIIDGTWSYTETQYDNFDRAIKVSEPFFDGATKLWNETSFDNYGRPLQMISATGKIANYTYPDFLTTNANDGTLNKTNVKNALGNVITLTDTPGGTITYKYFANGNLKKTVYDGQTTTIEQDGWGRKTKLIEPSAGEYNYTYNGFGQALTETSLNGTTAYTYTNIGKLDTKWVKGKTSPDGTFSGTNILSTYSYYPDKMLEKVTVTNPNDGNSVYDYTYDDYKRVIYTKEDFTNVAPRKLETESNTMNLDEHKPKRRLQLLTVSLKLKCFLTNIKTESCSRNVKTMPRATQFGR